MLILNMDQRIVLPKVSANATPKGGTLWQHSLSFVLLEFVLHESWLPRINHITYGGNLGLGELINYLIQGLLEAEGCTQLGTYL